jgi:hypothetical protein
MMGGFGQMAGMNDKPLAESLPRFREMAAEAQQAADHAMSQETKFAYQELADAWRQLLKEIEEAR